VNPPSPSEEEVKVAHRLFVVVSTGQNVANLPPLLEHAEQGDKVVWVESAPARRARWSEGARAVLSRLGLEVLPDDIVVEEIDDLAEMVRASGPAVELARRERLAVHVILNGGTKLTPLGLLRAWGDLGPVLLYGEQQPAVHKTFPATLDRPAEVRPYTRHELDLPEILEVSGHQIFDNAGFRFWPGPLADDLAREPYGANAAYTVDLHSKHHHRKDPGAEGPHVTWNEAQQVAAEQVQAWKRGILPPLRKRRLEISEEENGVFELIYTRTLGLLRAGARARNNADRVPIRPISDAFEQAVARRVHAWLEARKHPAILSAWRKVKVADRREPTRVKAELDVLLVLKNGVLWHLECKSFTADAKDLDARVFNLQQAGSQLARMALCAPLLTGYSAEPWFVAQHELRRRIEAIRHLTFVPFTLPGQPTDFVVEEGGTAQPLACPTLEAALEGALRAYLPRGA
jgi:hypothetical protein